jgi:hypothetical protein
VGASRPITPQLKGPRIEARSHRGTLTDGVVKLLVADRAVCARRMRRGVRTGQGRSAPPGFETVPPGATREIGARDPRSRRFSHLEKPRSRRGLMAQLAVCLACVNQTPTSMPAESKDTLGIVSQRIQC